MRLPLSCRYLLPEICTSPTTTSDPYWVLVATVKWQITDMSLSPYVSDREALEARYYHRYNFVCGDAAKACENAGGALCRLRHSACPPRFLHSTHAWATTPIAYNTSLQITHGHQVNDSERVVDSF
jgi:hypothetical protein